jgi:hypothetical protein
VPLTEAALARARERGDNDPLAAPLASYLEEHVDEELGHDETLLGDLELLGLDRATVLAQMPPPPVAGSSAASTTGSTTTTRSRFSATSR